MSLGITIFILISIYIKHEYSYDRFHRDSDCIFRVNTNFHIDNGKTMRLPASPPPLANSLIQHCPEVTSVVRFAIEHDFLLNHKVNKYYENNLIYADLSFFKVFDFPFILGNAEYALKEPNSIILTKSKVKKYFKDENPIGKLVSINNESTYKVTAIIDDIPINSHIHFDFIASTTNIPIFEGSNWGSLSLYTYVLTNKASSIISVQKQLPEIIKNYAGENWLSTLEFQLQPITKIHLHSNREQEYADTFDVIQIYFLSFLAFLILIISCANYANLFTSKHMNRSREAGIRKILGASRSEIIAQFMIESIMYASLSVILSIVLVQIALQYFNDIIQKNLEFNWSNNILELFVLTSFVGLISGCYPAIYFSKVQPFHMVKDIATKKTMKFNIRKGLILFQIAVVIAVFICVGITYKQMQFIKNKRLGFNKEQILCLRVRNTKSLESYERIKQELIKHPSIEQVTLSSDLIGNYIGPARYRPDEYIGNQDMWIRTLYVDYEYLKMLNINIIDGRNFSRHFSTDIKQSFIINEAALNYFGWNSIIDKSIIHRQSRNVFIKGNVIGVVSDFHYHSLHQPIEPLIIQMNAERFNYVNLKIKMNDISEILKYIKNKWVNFESEFPLDYVFLDDTFNNLYQSEQRLNLIFIFFASIAVIIACLGLLGLASFIVERRFREIGIRKVLGSSVSEISWLFFKEFLALILISFIVSSPIALFFMKKWLDNFAYRTDIDFWICFEAGLLTIVITIFTVGYQVIRASIINPAEVLKYE